MLLKRPKVKIFSFKNLLKKMQDWILEKSSSFFKMKITSIFSKKISKKYVGPGINYRVFKYGQNGDCECMLTSNIIKVLTSFIFTMKFFIFKNG